MPKYAKLLSSIILPTPEVNDALKSILTIQINTSLTLQTFYLSIPPMRMIAGTLSQAMPCLMLVNAVNKNPPPFSYEPSEEYEDEYSDEMEYKMREDTPAQ